jgi:alpha-1,2-mannosyltransferase
MAAGARTLTALASIVFVAANTVNALNKGGDAQDFFDGGRRLLQARPLYEGSGPASGFIGPPFQAAFFAPFAALADLSDVLARLAWYALNLVLLLTGVISWSRAWDASRARTSRDEGRLPRSAWFALLAILLPLQTNFEHQNMSALLLGIAGVAIWCLVGQRWMRAGALIGLAAALKVFPILAIVYAAARGWWACAATALATAIVLTALPFAIYGASFKAQVSSWVEIASGGWPTRPQNQSLIAAIDRLWPGGPSSAVHSSQQAPAEFVLFLAAAAVLVALALAVTRGRSRVAAQVPCEFAAVIVLAVLLSPVAWDHYWVLLFPACLLMYDARDRALLGRRAAVLFWIAAILISGLSRLTLGARGWSVARHFSTGTLAAILLYAGLVALWMRLAAQARPAQRQAPQPQ